MVAIPLNTIDETKISELYGNAPFFALLNTKSGAYTVVENDEIGSGSQIAPFLKGLGATGTMFYHMGDGVYKAFEKEAISVYKADRLSMTIDEINQSFSNQELIKLDSDNCEILLDPGENATCKCGCE